MGIKSPTPYQWKSFAKKRLHYGMNFAYGGTGVFDTNVLLPNMTTQIDFLEKLMLDDPVYVKADLQSSLVLVTLSGNDYGHFYTTGGTAQVNLILCIFSLCFCNIVSLDCLVLFVIFFEYPSITSLSH